jgi:hypothetical protein
MLEIGEEMHIYLHVKSTCFCPTLTEIRKCQQILVNFMNFMKISSAIPVVSCRQSRTDRLSKRNRHSAGLQTGLRMAVRTWTLLATGRNEQSF